MDNEEKGLSNVYKIETEKKLNIRKVLLVVFIIMLIILLFLTIRNINKTANNKVIFDEYEAQILKIKKEEEERLAKIKEEEEKKKKEMTPELTETGKKNIEKIYSSGSKRAFLTFDDGPSEVTKMILDTLKKEKIKASFFVLGSNVKINKDMTKRIYEEGHYLANHGYTHVYSSIYASPQAVLDEFNRCNDEVRKAIGNPDYNSHIFRFPGGFYGGKYANIKTKAKELLNKNNIVNVDWNALTGDAETNDLTPEFELKRLKETTEGKNSVVILMHDAPYKKVTAETLPNIIKYLRNQGYEFKTFYDLLK